MSNWKTLAIGMGAFLEQLEAHCSVQTGKTGPAHAAEGRELREAMGSFIALVREELAKPSTPAGGDALREAIATALRRFGGIDVLARKPDAINFIAEVAAREAAARGA